VANKVARAEGSIPEKELDVERGVVMTIERNRDDELRTRAVLVSDQQVPGLGAANSNGLYDRQAP